MPSLCRDDRLTRSGGTHARQAFFGHHATDAAQHEDVQNVDDGINLANGFQNFKNCSARAGTEYTAYDEHTAHLEINTAPLHMCKHARHACTGYLRGCGRRRNCRGDAIENQQGCCQEPAAYAEHTREHAHAATQQDDDQRIHRQIGYGKIYIHDRRIDPNRISRQDKG